MPKLFKRKKKKEGSEGGGKAGGRPPPAEAQGAGSDSDISLMTDSDDSLAEERAALRAALGGGGSSVSRSVTAARSATSASAEGGAAAPAAGAAAAAGGAAQRAPVVQADPFEHASLWAEVDTESLERLALGIARNVVPPAPAGGPGQEGADLAAAAAAAQRLSISAAVAEQAEAHDSTDPLGYGRIDTRTLTLVRDGGSSGALSKQRFAGRASTALDTLGRPRGSLRGELEGPPEAPPALRAKVLPGSEQFDAEAYLGTLHSSTGLPELQRGLQALRQQLSEHTGQLKALVKENFDRFISSKSTIDTVYVQLQRAEAEGEAGVRGASTTEVLDSLTQVQGDAGRVFGPLLERAAKADRIRLVLGAMRRYEALVGLPARARQHAEAGDYEQVVADYKRARALLADQAPPGAGPRAGQQQGQQGGMWAKLMDEIDKVVGGCAHSLDAMVRSATSTPAEAHDAIRHLLALRAAGVPAGQSMDPVGAYVEAQERHVRAVLEGRQAQHAARLESLHRQQRASEEYEAQAAALAGLGIGSPAPAISAPSPAAASPATSLAATPRGSSSAELAAAAEAASVQYVGLITGAMCQWLPDYWSLIQARLPALAAAGDSTAAGMVERGMVAAERSVTALLAAYRSAVQAVLGDPQAAGLTHAGLLSVAAELAAGCEALQAAAAAAKNSSSGGGSGSSAAAASPPAALQCLQVLAEQAVLASLAQLTTHLQAAVAQLCAAEDFRLTAASRRAGAPATASVAGLQALVQQGMAHLQAALAEAARAEVQPLRRSAAPARDAFFGCFAAYAAGCDALAAAIIAEGAGSGAGGQHSMAAEAAAAVATAASAGGASGGRREAAPPSPARRLLVLCANLGAVRGSLLPRQFSRWAGLLQAGGAAKELQAAAAECAAELEGVETGVGRAYIDRKQAQLDEVMEALLFGDGTAWEEAPPPAGLRPAAFDLLHALVAVQAELAASAPALLGEVMAELLCGVLDGFAQVLSSGSLPTCAAGAAQLWLEGGVLLGAVGGLGGELLQQAGGRLRAALDQQLEAAVAAAAAAGGPEAEELAAWAAGPSSGAAPSRLALAACRQRLEALQAEVKLQARANLLPLQQLGASAAEQ